ncbi:MAG: ribbon-helix-helix protein, CopG family [Gammaproteobacteria bacterium]
MGTRTVRLDDEAERTLARLRKLTGLSISEVLKRGLIAYKAKALEDSTLVPYEIYRQLDLGEGGYAVAPARQAKSRVRAAIERKHAR